MYKWGVWTKKILENVSDFTYADTYHLKLRWRHTYSPDETQNSNHQWKQPYSDGRDLKYSTDARKFKDQERLQL